MEKTRVFLIQHPGVTALVFAALVGACGYNAFYAGISYERLRSAYAWAASEALGG